MKIDAEITELEYLAKDEIVIAIEFDGKKYRGCITELEED